MKIALPSIGKMVDDHFGHCEYFTVYTIDENKRIKDMEIIDSSEGCGCKSNIASVLADKGVEVMLAGNMGEGAVSVLNGNGIKVIRGCKGNVQEVAEKWASGSLQDSGEVCHSHTHECSH